MTMNKEPLPLARLLIEMETLSPRPSVIKVVLHAHSSDMMALVSVNHSKHCTFCLSFMHGIRECDNL